MKRKPVFLYIHSLTAAILLAGLASCDDTVVSPEHSPVIVYITPVYARQVYYLNAAFDKNTELSVMAVYPNGKAEIVSTDRVSVSYAGTRIDDIDFVFNNLGSYMLDVGYAGMSVSYIVTVIDPSGVDTPPSGDNPPSNGGNNDGGLGIDIIGP
jgi:hypothetical protein